MDIWRFKTDQWEALLPPNIPQIDWKFTWPSKNGIKHEQTVAIELIDHRLGAEAFRAKASRFKFLGLFEHKPLVNATNLGMHVTNMNPITILMDGRPVTCQ